MDRMSLDTLYAFIRVTCPQVNGMWGRTWDQEEGPDVAYVTIVHVWKGAEGLRFKRTFCVDLTWPAERIAREIEWAVHKLTEGALKKYRKIERYVEGLRYVDYVEVPA